MVTTDVIGRDTPKRASIGLLLALAALTVLVHALAGGRYGFHRDELATLDDARHPAWGYVAYPPATPFFGWLSLHVFGTSLSGFRFFASLAGGVAIVLTGLMACELSGGRGAQLFAACAVAPMVIATGTLMQYVSFDYLAWVAVAFFMARLCPHERCAPMAGGGRDGRLWHAEQIQHGISGRRYCGGCNRRPAARASAQ
jgi:hypothetical protein